KQLKFIALHYSSSMAGPLQPALHKKSWAVIDRAYSLGCATVGALYERPRCIFCAKHLLCEEGNIKARASRRRRSASGLLHRTRHRKRDKSRRRRSLPAVQDVRAALAESMNPGALGFRVSLWSNPSR